MPGEFVYSEGKVRPLLALLLSLSPGIASGEGRVIAVSVNSIVHPITGEILTHAIDQARGNGRICC